MGFNMNFEPNQMKSVKTFTQFNVNGKDNPHYVVTMDYFYKILDELHYIFMNDKNMTDEQANDFIDKFISIDAQRVRQMRDIVNNCYIEKQKPIECANILLNKYYKIALINNTDVKNDEVTEISEKRYYHIKMASPTLFWNFFFKLKNNNILFNFNNNFIIKPNNSLNDEHYNLILKTDKYLIDTIKDIFIKNNIFKTILDVANDNDEKIQFYISLDNDNYLHFGYLYKNDEYSFGKLKPSNYDILKILNNSNSKKIMKLNYISNLKSILKILNYYKNILTKYLNKYSDTIFYIDIDDNNIFIVIETHDDDVININYIKNILDDNKYTKIKRDWNIEQKVLENKSYYYITLLI